MNEISIPKSISTIGDNAFNMCQKLNTIHYSGTTAEWEAISKADKWLNNVKQAVEIICSNGSIEINQSV